MTEERFDVWQYFSDDWHEQVGADLAAEEAAGVDGNNGIESLVPHEAEHYVKPQPCTVLAASPSPSP
jgi:hypothetical protein